MLALKDARRDVSPKARVSWLSHTFDGTFSSVGHNCLFSISTVYSLIVAGRFWRGLARCSVEHAALVGWDHVLDVDEGVVSSMLLEQLKGPLNQITEVHLLALRVVDFVALVQVVHLEQVHDGQDLTVVGHQGLANRVTC